MNPFTHMNPSSRLWIYQSDRLLTDDEITAIQQYGKQFVRQWNAHGATLIADVAVLEKLCLMFAVDETRAAASGCSIDTSVHFVRQLENQFGVSLLNRMSLAYRDTDSQIRFTTRRDMKTLIEQGIVTEDTMVFNNTISTVADLDRWEVPLRESWHADAFLTRIN